MNSINHTTDDTDEVENSVPQPGESSGKKPLLEGTNRIETNGKIEEINCMLTASENLSLTEILTTEKIDKTSIPYYQEVHQDLLQGDDSWPVTKKVKEYALYLEKNPSTIAALPPLQILNGKLHDGAHRISALYLLAKQNPNSSWANLKVRVDFYITVA
jgi:hypothetical protein